VLSILPFLQTSLTFAATEITGTVTAKRGDSVQVTFAPHDTAGPKIGDKVAFSKEIPGTGGIKAKAGEGTVTEIDGATIWVKTSDNRPNLKMDAVIQATGQVTNEMLLQQIYQHYLKNKDAENYALLEGHAREGNAQAQYYMGLASVSKPHLKSEATDWFVNILKESAQWFRLAADQGHTGAMLELGKYYHIGFGVPTDYDKALEYLTRASDAGILEATANLGSLYLNFFYKGKDEQKGLRLLQKSIEQGSPDAMYFLGNYYYENLGAYPEDRKEREEGIKWYKKAAQLGHGVAKRKLEDIKRYPRD
jgi:tetratricopeptide (TPR) repeat protein